LQRSDTYDTFVRATTADLEERQHILKQLSDNYAELEVRDLKHNKQCKTDPNNSL